MLKKPETSKIVDGGPANPAKPGPNSSMKIRKRADAPAHPASGAASASAFSNVVAFATTEITCDPAGAVPAFAPTLHSEVAAPNGAIAAKEQSSRPGRVAGAAPDLVEELAQGGSRRIAGGRGRSEEQLAGSLAGGGLDPLELVGHRAGQDDRQLGTASDHAGNDRGKLAEDLPGTQDGERQLGRPRAEYLHASEQHDVGLAAALPLGQDDVALLVPFLAHHG